MGDVVVLGGSTKLPVPVNRVLDGAKEKDLKLAMVIGYNEQGEMWVASSHTNIAELNLLLDRTKFYLMHRASQQPRMLTNDKPDR